MEDKMKIDARFTGLIAIIIILAFVPIVALYSCERGSGRIIEKTFDITNFDAIVFEGNGIVYLSQGNEDIIKVETDDNIMPSMKIKKNDGIVFISTSRNVCTNVMKVYVTARNIAKLGISGSGDIIGQTPIKGKALRIRIEGSGDIKLKGLDLDFFSAILNGSGDLRLQGKANQSEFKIAGSGDIYSYDFVSKSSDVNISGSGDVQINVSESLNVNIDGSGDVHYKGSPSNVSVRTNGSGDVRAFK